MSNFPRVLGRPTQWDESTHALIQDVVVGDIVSVPLPVAQLEMTEIWAKDPGEELLGPFDDTDANIRQVRTRRLMFVPPRFLPLVINRRLTPREVWKDLVGAIEAEGVLVDCREHMDWATLAAVHPGVGSPSNVRQPLPQVPLADVDAAFLRHRRDVLLRQVLAL